MPLQKYEFLDIFQDNPDGTLTVKRPIRISGVTLVQDISIGVGVVVGGIDFHKFKYRPIAGEEEGGAVVIRGFFQ